MVGQNLSLMLEALGDNTISAVHASTRPHLTRSEYHLFFSSCVLLRILLRKKGGVIGTCKYLRITVF